MVIVKNKNIKVISLGGSTIFHNLKFNSEFLKQFKIILKNSYKKNKTKFIIVVGGGNIARLYVKELRNQNKIQKLNLTNSDYDNVGIKITNLNALFLEKLFNDISYDVINKYDDQKINNFLKSKNKFVLFVYGDKIGYTSDYDAVQFAVKLKVKEVINITNIDYVYTKNPNEFKSAKPLKNLSWKEFFKIIGTKYISSGHYPFDPFASKICEKNNISVYSVSYKNLKSIEYIFNITNDSKENNYSKIMKYTKIETIY